MTVSENTLGVSQSHAERVRARRLHRTRQVERPKRIKPERSRSRKQGRPRRRYDVALGAERGAEIQVRVIPSGFLGARVFSMGLIVFAILSLLQFTRAERFKVTLPEVEGAQMLSTAQVRSLASIEGQSVFFLDPMQIESRLEEAAEVKNSKVRFQWPNVVSIELEERTPVAAWNDGGRIWWLSDDGIAYIQHGERNDLIQISSDAGTLNLSSDELAPAIDPTVLEGVTELQAQLPAVNNWNYDDDHGLGFVDASGRQVYLGNGSMASQKAKAYLAIADKLDSEQIQATVISVTDHNAPYYSVE
ncbi:MAG: FtsQ-type POTRA domain-containing protein [Anaerolineales bacterium]|jgi:cell division septal protein FtsQ